ncbi:MAG TPA: His/Gly/Thr/Pro-type tRNA ligase C-terminal domain-containing protein, partial [Gemmatimonadales bacterium]
GAQADRTLDAFLVPVTVADFPVVLELAHRLRDQGVSVEYALREQGIAKQLKLAASRPARLAVVIGPDERAKGEVVVRHLDNGTEEHVSLTKLEAYAWK